jgi:hypothetical protein
MLVFHKLVLSKLHISMDNQRDLVELNLLLEAIIQLVVANQNAVNLASLKEEF